MPVTPARAAAAVPLRWREAERRAIWGGVLIVIPIASAAAAYLRADPSLYLHDFAFHAVTTLLACELVAALVLRVLFYLRPLVRTDCEPG